MRTNAYVATRYTGVHILLHNTFIGQTTVAYVYRIIEKANCKLQHNEFDLDLHFSSYNSSIYKVYLIFNVNLISVVLLFQKNENKIQFLSL